MSVNLVVSDIDGTLVDKRKQVTPATIAAVRKLRRATPFTVISARPMSGMLPVADALGLTHAMAAFNGGLIFTRDGQVSYHETIDPVVARGVIALADGRGVETWVFAGDRWYASDCDGPHTRSERITANQEPLPLGDPAALLYLADKITFVSDDESLLRALAADAHHFGDRAMIAQSQTYYLDVTALGANKGAGIEKLCEAYGVALADTAAIGDQANDLPMLTRAGLAIAMGNAPDAVKAAAGHVTRGNDADGVAHAIDTIILNGADA